jgi:hypothetical protein
MFHLFNLSKGAKPMLDGTKRGQIAGAEVARNTPQGASLPVEEITVIAGRELASMREKGYAHLDPEPAFIESFVRSFQQYFVLSSASL